MNTIRSMTGFGRSEQISDEYRILVEIKSVNHRYLDLSIKMPKMFNCFEARIRQLLKEYIERGKTDVFITYEDYAGKSKRLIYNRELAAEYIHYINAISEEFSIRNDIGASAFARLPDVLVMEENTEPDEKLWGLLEPVIRDAADALKTERTREGEHLKKDLLDKTARIRAMVEEIEEMSPSISDAYRRRLYDKIKETLSDQSMNIDEARIITEVTIYADRVCTDEEMVRLRSHAAAMEAKLSAGGSCGRELDFLAQEMNREANTTLSKANNLNKADLAIALKTEIEKIREQVQNIE